MPTQLWRYDGSVDGFLTCVFEAYRQGLLSTRQPSVAIATQLTILRADNPTSDLLSQETLIDTDPAKAARVHNKLLSVMGNSGVRDLLCAMLSEQEGIELCLLSVIHYALCYPKRAILKDYSHPAILALSQCLKSISRERHRMKAFVRFEEMHLSDSQTVYFARIAPDFNVLPLIAGHFCARYQDQQWAIYDTVRGYGMYFDTQRLTVIEDIDPEVLAQPQTQYTEVEARYQRYWQGYFANVTIRERKNPRLHRQHVPQRYWQYLTEKQVLPNAQHLQKKKNQTHEH